jgi:hypothetical protein
VQEQEQVYWNVDTATLQADGVVAQGITIESGAALSVFRRGEVQLPVGTVFSVITSTSAAGIAGTFGNLAEGATITVDSNTFQANYEGGDGNDLTLTVVQ